MTRNLLLPFAALAMFCGGASAPDTGMQWRKAAWAMRSVKPPINPAGKAAWGKPVFLQPLALAETATVTTTSSASLPAMPLAKAPVTLEFPAGMRFHRVLTGEPGRRIYCGADSGYSAKTAMIKLESRLCLADDNGDMTFDRLLLASISRPAQGQPPLSPVYLLGLDNPSYQPLVISDDPRQAVAIPYTVAQAGAEQFFAGPVLFRNGKDFAVGLMLADDKGKGTATTLFDPSADGVPASTGMPATLAKRPQFKHMAKIDLSALPATIELPGATLIVRSVDAEGAEVEVVRDFSGATVPVAFSGVVAP